MTDNAEWTKLIISAFFGGGVASIFNYYAQKCLANWKASKEEKKLAYVYLIKLSYLISFTRLIKSYVAALMQHKDTSNLDNMKAENLEMTHQISILIADELNKIISTKEFEKQITQLNEIDGIFKDFIEFKIKEELLSKASKESILEYQLLTQSLDSIKYSINIWMDILINKKSCEAFFVYQTWLVLKKVHEHSEKLFRILLEKSDIPNYEGEEILRSQLIELQESLLAGLVDKEKIEKAITKRQENG